MRTRALSIPSSGSGMRARTILVHSREYRGKGNVITKNGWSGSTRGFTAPPFLARFGPARPKRLAARGPSPPFPPFVPYPPCRVYAADPYTAFVTRLRNNPLERLREILGGGPVDCIRYL